METAVTAFFCFIRFSAMEIQSTSTPMNAKGKDHLVTLVKDHLG